MQHVTFNGKINCIKISINAICNTKVLVIKNTLNRQTSTMPKSSIRAAYIFFMEKNGQFAVIVLQMEIFPEDIARHLKMVRLSENIRHMVI